MCAREPHALAERHEGVVGAGHEHAVLAALFDLVAEELGEFEDDGLLHLPARRSRPVVDTAMAGIDYDQRPCVAVTPGLRLHFRPADLRRPVLDRGAQEGLAIAD